ncbi:MAG: hypothetical protein KDB03_28700 [Planctomycetales bacterium]|nr:hypothetical protein [Planctomycetales bacterium]
MQPSFWLVELGRGMGPISLGMTRAEVASALRLSGVNQDVARGKDKIKTHVSEINTTLVFSDGPIQRLIRLDISHSQVNFAGWEVIGKPIHKLVRLFKCPDSATLWCNDYEPNQQLQAIRKIDQSNLPTDAQLLNFGTLWLTALGLGCTVRRGTIICLHICNQESVPKLGTGCWNRPQQVMSETGHIPTTKNKLRTRSGASLTLKGLLIVAMCVLAARATWIQMRWNALPDVEATVVAVAPPPPSPFGEFFHLQYRDSLGNEFQAKLERMQFYDEPKLGQQVEIRFLPEAPHNPLGPHRWSEVGMNLAIPYALAILTVYTITLLLASIFKL